MARFCSKCGNENLDSDIICKNCGCSLIPNEKAEDKPKKNTWSKVWSIVGLVIGCIVCLFGIIFIIDGSVRGTYVSYAAFGGDFYTEIHKATRAAAENITYAAEAIHRDLGFVIASIGAFMACYFGKSINS